MIGLEDMIYNSLMKGDSRQDIVNFFGKALDSAEKRVKTEEDNKRKRDRENYIDSLYDSVIEHIDEEDITMGDVAALLTIWWSRDNKNAGEKELDEFLQKADQILWRNFGVNKDPEPCDCACASSEDKVKNDAEIVRQFLSAMGWK